MRSADGNATSFNRKVESDFLIQPLLLYQISFAFNIISVIAHGLTSGQLVLSNIHSPSIQHVL